MRLWPVALLLVTGLAGCALMGAPAPVSPPLQAATHAAPSPSPPPTLIPLPTQSIWLDWTSSNINLALHKPVRVSHQVYGRAGLTAVDGNLRTFWNSGAGPTQWIEIDLGAAYDIAEIHLVPADTSPGVTLHRILGKGPLSGGYRLLYVFNSQVSDSPILAYAHSSAWQDVSMVRIETTFSAGPIGWREVEIMQAAY